VANYSQQAYEHIRSKLTLGLFDGGDLSEPGLARELGISRTPVREAIRQLASEGLLEQRPKQGTFIRRPDRRELDEIYQVRILLEPFAASQAAKLFDASGLRELHTLLAGMAETIARCRRIDDEAGRERLLQVFAGKDTAFHESILRAGANRRIQKIVADANIVALAMAFPKDSRLGALHGMVRAYREHQKIARALKRRDSRAARLAMLRHLTRAHRSTLDYCDYLERLRQSNAGWPSG
jgi:DNA-binding GntR family transcriptional regulator